MPSGRHSAYMLTGFARLGCCASSKARTVVFAIQEGMRRGNATLLVRGLLISKIEDPGRYDDTS